MTSWNATLRTATADDVDAILQFYKDNPNKNVLGRSDAVRNACENGRQFLVEVEGAIVGVSGAFPSGAKSLVEVGGTRVADDWQGFGLQERLFWARFAAIVLTEDRDVQITTAVDPDNATSKHSILKQGFAKWDEPAPELLVECDPGPGRAGCEKKAALPAGAKCCSPLCQRHLRQSHPDIFVPMGGEWFPKRAQANPSSWSRGRPCRGRAQAA